VVESSALKAGFADTSIVAALLMGATDLLPYQEFAQSGIERMSGSSIIV
jgi:hypothetical protein